MAEQKAECQRIDAFELWCWRRLESPLDCKDPGAAHRQFEIVSNGPADTLDLTYWVDGTQHVISLEDVGLADSQWKNVTVQVTGETYSLYVGCDLMDSFTLDEPFYEHLQTERSRMYVAKGAARESHFRVGPADTPTRPGWGGAGSWGVHMGRRERKEHPCTPAGLRDKCPPPIGIVPAPPLTVHPLPALLSLAS